VERVLEEVRHGTLSREKAKSDYGVVVDPKTRAFDAAATVALRGGK
jgi:N-methylhydantoinase B/oxoprolinase/acetone carboxylase alpha subunit